MAAKNNRFGDARTVTSRDVRADSPKDAAPARKGGTEPSPAPKKATRAPKEGAGEDGSRGRVAKADEYTTYGFRITIEQHKALNRLKGIDEIDRSEVVRQALDEWFAAHAGDHPEALGSYAGK